MRLRTSLFVSSFAVASVLSADTVTLKSGKSIQGTYLGGTSRQVRMDVNGEVRSYDLNQVQSITFQNDDVEALGSADPARRDSPRTDGRSATRNQDESDSRADSRPRLRRVDPSDVSSAPASLSSSSNDGGAMGVTLDAGTSLTVRMIDPVDSETSRIGQTFRASIDEPVTVGDRVVIPRGADVLTKLVADQKSGKIQGSTVLTLVIMNVTVNGQPVDMTTSDVQTASSSRGKKSAGVIGGGTALGAIIGGIAGGGRGAAIGAASGAAAGTGVQTISGGQKVKIPSETRLTFRLQNPVRL